jgi:protein tyrosine/serine phosphatase
MLRTILCLLAFPALLAAGEPGVDIPRFQKVDEGFFRGGQPDKTGFEYLKKQGIKTVINLRDESNEEEPVVKGLGMNYVHLPMSVTIGTKISQNDITEYFKVISNPDNYPIYIHCRRGADRTGVMVGFYRIAVQGWDGKKAHDEARKIGMRWWYTGLKSQLYSFKKPADMDMKPLLPAAIVATP